MRYDSFFTFIGFLQILHLFLVFSDLEYGLGRQTQDEIITLPKFNLFVSLINIILALSLGTIKRIFNQFMKFADHKS